MCIYSVHMGTSISKGPQNRLQYPAVIFGNLHIYRATYLPTYLHTCIPTYIQMCVNAALASPGRAEPCCEGWAEAAGDLRRGPWSSPGLSGSGKETAPSTQNGCNWNYYNGVSESKGPLLCTQILRLMI